MKNISVALLFCLTSCIAHAQQIVDMQKQIKCSDAQTVMNHFSINYQETLLWVGKTDTGTHITLLVNQETRSWTMIEYDSNMACVLGAGETSSKPEI
jgi:hypothetical protein